VIAPHDPKKESRPCSICREKFEKVFNEEEGQWVWYNAVEVDGRIDHAICREEMRRGEERRKGLKKSVTGGNDGRTREGTPTKEQQQQSNVMASSNIVKAEDQNQGINLSPRGTKLKNSMMNLSEVKRNNEEDFEDERFLSNLKTEDLSLEDHKKVLEKNNDNVENVKMNVLTEGQIDSRSLPMNFSLSDRNLTNDPNFNSNTQNQDNTFLHPDSYSSLSSLSNPQSTSMPVQPNLLSQLSSIPAEDLTKLISIINSGNINLNSLLNQHTDSFSTLDTSSVSLPGLGSELRSSTLGKRKIEEDGDAGKKRLRSEDGY
jgi:hypothetical protein